MLRIEIGQVGVGTKLSLSFKKENYLFISFVYSRLFILCLQSLNLSYELIKP